MGKEVFMNMDKQKFTAALVRRANETAGWTDHDGGFMGFHVEDNTYSNAAVLSMYRTYFYCPCVPRSPAVYQSYGMSDTEIRKLWTEFWERVKSEYSKSEDCRCNFSGKDKTFNWNNGKTAIVLNGKIYVCMSANVDYEMLRELGFTKDSNLCVPFSNGEAYYEPSADHHCNNCGLLSMC